jgi:UV DNA damage repair endonuclease
MSWGLEDCLSLSDIVPTVLDVHHHWIREGEYIDPRDSRVQRVIESWRGTRPTLHYSVSREDVLVAHDTEIKPDMGALLASGYKKQKLRAHSDFYWNTGVNRWALGFLDNFDIMCESKGKNLASFELHALAKSA